MSEAARITIAATRGQVWRVLADIDTWPSWSPSVVAVFPERADEHLRDRPDRDGVGERSAYRVDQPPLPLAVWTITDWRPERGFTWQTQGASSLTTVTYDLSPGASGRAVGGGKVEEHAGDCSEVSINLRWSGAMAWMARAAYGPVSIRYADAHLTALARRCETDG